MASVLQKNFINDFTICRSKKYDVAGTKLIILSDISDIVTVLAILGEAVSVYEPDFENFPDILNVLEGKSHLSFQEDCLDNHLDVLKVSEKIGISS